jgi:AAA domain-containing protein
VKIASLELTSFGAFRDRTLTFAPGLNVIWGPNESGKSTVHAALIALVTGLPAPAERRAEDVDFADRHQPWGMGAHGWRVAGRISLSNGTEVDIDRNLADPLAAGDRPQVMGPHGEDLGESLIWEGAADCSRWLGLNRRSFVVTAAIGQGDILRVVLTPGVLRDDLRRAAAGAGFDLTVENALRLLDVDLDDELAVEIEQLSACREMLDRTVAARDRQVRLELEADTAQDRARQLSTRLRALEAAIARTRAQELRQRLERAGELLESHPEQPARDEPPTPAEEQARAALAAWSGRPEIPELSGRTVPELQAKLESISEQAVEGDIVPDAGVLAAREVYEYANQELDRHWAARPAEAEPVISPLGSEVLRELAQAIETSPPEPSGNVGRLLRRRDGDDRPHPVTYARMQGLDPNPPWLRELAGQVEIYERAQAEQKRWTTRMKRLRQESVNAEARLRSALASRGLESPQGQVMQTVFRYVRECEERARLAARADEREQLEQQLRVRQLIESQRADALVAHENAAAGIRAAAEAASIKGREPDRLATGLRRWIDSIDEQRQSRERAREAWRELTQLLEGRTVAELAKEADRRQRRASALEREVGGDSIAAVEMIGDGGEQLAQLRKDAEQAQRDAAAALSAVETSTVLDHPAVAEEAWGEAARAVWELAEFRSALELARERLTEAALAMNADVAPAVAGVLRRWLPRLTGGKYNEAWVDPATLQVDVRGADGDWQPAAMLSQATAEQIYLLLRIALAEHLTPEEGSCPLLLDDVTVHADTERVEALLEILHEVSADHQVILFTGEDRVLAWAERNLGTARDLVQTLETPTTIPV